jgi:hypothetical protein
VIAPTEQIHLIEVKMNTLKISDCFIDNQEHYTKIRPLFPCYHEYERRKKELSKQNLPKDIYDYEIRNLVIELGL